MTDRSEIEALIQEAEESMAADNWEGAREIYKQVVSQDPNDVDVRERVLAAAKRALDFQVIIGQDMALAELFVANGEADKAIDSYKDILNLEKLAQSQGITGNKLANIQALVAQVKPEIFAKTGIIYLNEGRHTEAIKWLRPSLDLDPSRWDTHMAVGRGLRVDNKSK